MTYIKELPALLIHPIIFIILSATFVSFGIAFGIAIELFSVRRVK